MSLEIGFGNDCLGMTRKGKADKQAYVKLKSCSATKEIVMRVKEKPTE